MQRFFAWMLFLLFFGTLAPDAAVASVVSGETSVADEVDSLKSRVSTWDRILSALPEVSGYVQTGYEYSETSSTFYIKRVRLSLGGELFRGLSYRVQAEFAGSPKLVDAYLQYGPFEQLNVRLGEYKVPFSIENTEYAPLKFEFIEYPMALQRLMGFDEPIGTETFRATGRDMGATLYGGFFKRDGYCIVNYDLGVFNGSGLNVNDSNRSKDVVARLTVKPFSGLQLSGSYYWGEYGSDYLGRERYGVGACYDRNSFMLRGEWIGGTTGLPAGGNVQSRGWYVAGGWRATRTLMPVVRYDTYLADASARDTRQTNYTAGAVWQPVRRLRCQFNYTYEDHADPGVSSRNVVSLMLTGIF